jgi:hypothetical protein
MQNQDKKLAMNSRSAYNGFATLQNIKDQVSRNPYGKSSSNFFQSGKSTTANNNDISSLIRLRNFSNCSSNKMVRTESRNSAKFMTLFQLKVTQKDRKASKDSNQVSHRHRD